MKTHGSRAMEHITALGSGIGPRPPTSQGEREAADYVGQEMQRLGGSVSQQSFPAARTFSHPFLVIYSLGTLAGALTIWWPAVGVGLGLVALALFWLEVDTRGPVWRLCSAGQSVNVIGRFAAHVRRKRLVVVTAHHDTSRSALLFAPNRVAGFRVSFLAMAASFVLIPCLALGASLLAGAPGRVLALLAGLPALYLLLSVVVLVHRELFGSEVAGANDNASGVGVMLELAQHLPLQHTEVWLVSTGAEEAGCLGAMHLVAEHGEELGEARFINLDNIGAGNPRYTTHEGMLTRFASDPELVEQAGLVASTYSELGFAPVSNTIMSTDAVALMARGHRAISLRAEDDNRLLPNWHWPTDVVENIQPKTVSAMVRFTLGLLQLIDAGVAAAPAEQERP